MIRTNGIPRGRHETSFVECLGKFYLIGGREADGLIECFDPAMKTWSQMKATSPLIHHYQPLVYDKKIYMVGAMTGFYPDEPPMDSIQIYDPVEDLWKIGGSIPEERRRGGSGAVLYNGKIYIAGGITSGHTSGTNGWFDSYNPETDSWEKLADAPHIRDHFHGVVVGHKLYCIGGRNGSFHDPDFESFFAAVINEIDVYDFETSTWSILPPVSSLPVGSAEGGVATLNGKILYFGGENATEALELCWEFDPETEKWSELPPLNQGRHGTQAISYSNKVWVACGSPLRGGSARECGNVSSMEVYSR
ncbi:MAG: hypothetical protein JEY99_09775 [Spirochaetales bacterium]|nr:hypothetical protein [Spirochaetales bacterium]